MLPLLTPAHLDRDFDYLVPPELADIARPGVRVRVRFAGRLVDGYLLSRHAESDHPGKLVRLERVVSAEQVLTPEILRLATTVAARCAGTRADVLRLAIPPRHARVENGGPAKKAAETGPGAETGSGANAGMRAEAGADSDAGTATNAGSGVGAGLRADAELGTDAVPGTAAEPRMEPVSVVDTGLGTASEPGVGAGLHADAEPGTDAVPATGAGPGADAEPRMDTVPGAHAGSGADAATATDAGPGNYAGSGADGGPGADAEPGTETGPGTGNDAGTKTEVGAPRGAGRTAGSGSGGEAVPLRVVDVPGAAEAPGESGGSPVHGSDTGSAGPRAADRSDVAGRAALPAGVDTGAWRRYRHGDAFLTALAGRRGPRAAWQALPGEDWARRLAELAAVVAADGRSAILMVPDQRDLDRVLRECERLVGDSAVGLSAGLGPAARYRRWLAVLRGTARVVVGTRSAVFAPAVELGLIAIWDDGDDTYAEPRAPYPHTREVAMLRAHDTGAAFVAAGFARTAEIQAVVETGWAHDLLADRATVRAAAPRISAPGDSDTALERDPMARAIRIPAAAFAAARKALAAGSGVLVQVPRRGYVPALACTKCRTPARCRRCVGPLSLPGSDRPAGNPGAAHSPVCRWCGRTEAAFRCPACGGRVLRAVVIGAARTAEELGRAFPGVPIRGSSGAAVLDTVPPGPQVVVATVGAEPLLAGGYGVGLLLDGWALLGRADLRAAEDALRRWLSAAALVRPDGEVLVMADPAVPTVQALLRWDPAGHAAAELAQRTEVGFPPAVRMAAVDGTPDGIAGLLAAAELPAAVEVLGPVPLPAAARLPFGARGDSDDPGAEVERVLLRTPRTRGAALVRALTAAQAIRSSQRAESPPRIQIDPLEIG
ncbi:primosomal protein N' [Nocardia zapadnayensis]|uniref:primosomal protein N' family DNA-binding protein n=1 Tax=Nocardia rhamnosiphila TaxID=426716 RepID=UPI002245133B|nr:primosomal protein N' [Nocardia zapadnayensis]MCX0272306.1 primosomal protein N' [Nocardia zapadnayensis]